MSRSGRSFFGLPEADDPKLGAWVSAHKKAQLSEIRMVCQEAGDYDVVRRMPVEIRRWWLEQMRKKEGQGGEPGVRVDPQTGRRFVTQDVR